MHVGPDCQDRTGQIELQDFHIWGRFGEDIGDFGQTFFEEFNSLDMIDAVVQLSL